MKIQRYVCILHRYPFYHVHTFFCTTKCLAVQFSSLSSTWNPHVYPIPLLFQSFSYLQPITFPFLLMCLYICIYSSHSPSIIIIHRFHSIEKKKKFILFPVNQLSSLPHDNSVCYLFYLLTLIEQIHQLNQKQPTLQSNKKILHAYYTRLHFPYIPPTTRRQTNSIKVCRQAYVHST